MNASSSWLRCLIVACTALLCACGNYEEKRIREAMVEKGFGSRAEGDSRYENYVGGGDFITFLIPSAAVGDPDTERLVALQTTQMVRVDGTILIPYLGPLYVLGMTEAQLGALVKNQLRPLFKKEIDVQAIILSGGKFFYALGESGRKGPIRLEPDLTIWRAMFLVGWSSLANLGRVQIIRPDAENPLVMEVNVREMYLSGFTNRNFSIRENDLIYVPPTFLGLVARLLERILDPVSVAVTTMLGIARIQNAYDIVTGETNRVYFRF
ncbi:MAG: polysaccharide biosynthesis/export family protein [Planctomycetes bacterium]|nr:polysaccharide biosynthesis/export family protein [Planctomycetota bacterium]